MSGLIYGVNTLKIKLHTNKKREEFNEHFKHVKLTMRALLTNTLMAATDEFINHQSHMWTVIMIPIDKANCIKTCIWKVYYKTL